VASLSIHGLRKSYGEVQILHGLDLQIPNGSFVVLLGPSGCGKSTLLRMIAGLESTTAGDIHIGRNAVTDTRAKDRNIAMVFQNYALYAHKTVFENMAFALRLRKMSQAEIDSRVKAAAEMLHLGPYLHRLPRELSGGQRQRVAMGRAVVRDPAVFLFDEPLSNLDAKLRVHMRAEIKALHQRLKATTVYVTHDQIEAMTLADIVVVMKEGHIAQSGAPLDIYDRPNSLFVAGFVGSPAMNFLHGEVDGLDGAPAVRLVDGSLLPIPEQAKVKRGQRVVFGVRPEHFELRPVDDPEPGVTAGVQVVEPTGADTHVLCSFDNQELRAVTPERLRLEPGTPIRLKAMPDKVHVFDEVTGLAV
jgi:multiple sugar transport system ATP-binding protein